MTTVSPTDHSTGRDLLSYGTQTVTAVLLLAMCLRSGHLAVQYSGAGLAEEVPYRLSVAVFTGLLGLWMLPTRIYNRSLGAMASGPLRLLHDLAMVATLYIIASVLLSFAAYGDPMLPRWIARPQIQLFLLTWVFLFIWNFLIPAEVFNRRHGREDPLPQAGGAGVKPGAVRRRARSVRETLMSLPLAAMVLLGLFSLISPLWLPSPAHLKYSDDSSALLGLGLGIIGAFLGWIAADKAGASPLAQGNRHVGSMSIGFVSLALLAFWLSAIGLPYVASYAIPTTMQRFQVTVVEMGHKDRPTGCNYTATVTYAEYPKLQTGICNIPPALWNTLTPGDQLVIEGPGNAFGARYTRISRAG